MAQRLRIFAQVGRSSSLVRVVAAYAAFILTEYSVWIAMLVYAYSLGGATEAGVIALAQLVPAAIAAPLASAIADRRSPVLLLAGGYLVQALGSAAVAVAIMVEAPPICAYLGAVLASTAVSTSRPAQAALVPALARDVSELTATNVLVGWTESVAIMVAGAFTGLTLAWGGVGHVFGLSAVLLVGAAWLVSPLRAQSPGRGDVLAGARREITGGFHEAGRSGTARLLVGLLAAEFVVIGALDVLFVVLAIDVLDLGQSWAGYLNMAYGVGGVVLGAFAVLLVGRRLGPVIVVAAVVIGLALGATAVNSRPIIVVVLLAIVGGSRALYDVSTRSLLQRAVPAEMVARLFGIAEGLSMAGLAVGSVLAPALIALGGPRLALTAVAAILPLFVLTRVGMLIRVDQQAQVPIVEISLLRSLPIFHGLPGPAVEGLAHAAERVDFEQGTVIVREGDPGDLFYAIAHGSVEIRQAGQPIAVVKRGSGLGEIALLRDGLRTATAVALTPVSAFSLDRVSFLTTVNGHAPTRQTADAIVSDLRERDRRRRLPRERPDSD